MRDILAPVRTSLSQGFVEKIINGLVLQGYNQVESKEVKLVLRGASSNPGFFHLSKRCSNPGQKFLKMKHLIVNAAKPV